MAGENYTPSNSDLRQLGCTAKELEAAFKETDPKERKVIRENIDKSTERISEYEAKIFGGQEVENVRKALYKFMESEKLRLRPEAIAEDTAKKKLKLPALMAWT